MKKLISILTVLLFIMSVSSCKKEDKIAPIEGTWLGTYLLDGPNESALLHFTFTANNTMNVVNGYNNVTSNGTWTLAGNNFEAKWTEVFNGNTTYYTFRATVDAKATLFTNGTWSQSSSQNSSFVSLGIWTMIKQ